MARPTKYKYRTLRRILKHLRRGGTKRAACAAAGIDTTTLEDWERDKSGLSACIKRAQDYAIWKHERALEGRVANGKSDTCLIFWLKCQGGWKDRQVVEHTGEVKHKHEKASPLEELWERVPEGDRPAVLKVLQGGNGNGSKSVRAAADKGRLCG